MQPFSWKCAYCGHATTITEPNYSEWFRRIETSESRYESIGLRCFGIACPNQDCKELTLAVHLHNGEYDLSYDFNPVGSPIEVFPLLPRSEARPQPDYIPEEIRNNYYEACLILGGSPKASAALARRCLQGVVRDFWEIPSNKRGNLGAELSQIRDKVTADTWEAIQAVRSVGDIGAHMEKDVNVIIDVEPSEAKLLIELIETLLEDWYVERHKRRARNQRLKQVADEKLALKKDGKKGNSDVGSEVLS